MSVGANGVARLWNTDDGALVADIKEEPRAARAVAKSDGALNYAKACVEYRKEDLRDAYRRRSSTRERPQLEEANKGKTTDEKAVVDKTEPARKAVEARAAAQVKLAAAEATYNAAKAKQSAAQAAIEPAEQSLKKALAALDQATQAAAKDNKNAALGSARTAAEKSGCRSSRRATSGRHCGAAGEHELPRSRAEVQRSQARGGRGYRSSETARARAAGIQEHVGRANQFHRHGHGGRRSRESRCAGRRTSREKMPRRPHSRAKRSTSSWSRRPRAARSPWPRPPSRATAASSRSVVKRVSIRLYDVPCAARR